RRVQELERRMAALEGTLGRGVEPRTATVASAEPPLAAEAPAAAAPQPAPDATPAEESPPLAPARHPVRKGGVGDAGSVTLETTVTVATPAAPARNPLRTWFTDGNTMVRVGVVVLFFGVAFLLSYFAEHVTVPIEFQFLAVAALGFA